MWYRIPSELDELFTRSDDPDAVRGSDVSRARVRPLPSSTWIRSEDFFFLDLISKYQIWNFSMHFRSDLRQQVDRQTNEISLTRSLQ